MTAIIDRYETAQTWTASILNWQAQPCIFPRAKSISLGDEKTSRSIHHA